MSLDLPLYAIEKSNHSVKLQRQHAPFTSVFTIGPGSASPVVSITIREKAGTRPLGEQVINCIDQITPDRTADTPIFKEQCILYCGFNQQVIKSNFAKFVDNEGSRFHPRLTLDGLAGLFFTAKKTKE